MSYKPQTPTKASTLDFRSVIIGALLLLGILACLPRISASEGILCSVLGFALVSLGFLGLQWRHHCDVVIRIRRPHWVQCLTHSTIFIYWGVYVPQVIGQVPLLLAQICVAYVVDGLACAKRTGRWYLGFGPIPVVGSINLFLWFKDDYWSFQIAMVVFAMLAKHLFVWRGARRGQHIFNPSGLALFTASVALLATGSSHITWGELIATSLNVPVHMYLVIFATGLLVQALFQTTLVTAGAALSVWALVELHHVVYGGYFFTDTEIPIAVFLGMNLLITDPSTSPRPKLGRLLYGIAYGLCVLPLWSFLNVIGQPAFFDKLLQVPLLNLCVPWFEQLSHRLSLAFASIQRVIAPLTRNPIHLGVWALSFYCLLPRLTDHPGASPDTWRPDCSNGRASACANLRHVLAASCGKGRASACREMADRLNDSRSAFFAPVEASMFYRRACKAGHKESCAQPVPQPLGKQAGSATLQTACHQTPKHCGRLGKFFLARRPTTTCPNKQVVHLHGPVLLKMPRAA